MRPSQISDCVSSQVIQPMVTRWTQVPISEAILPIVKRRKFGSARVSLRFRQPDMLFPFRAARHKRLIRPVNRLRTELLPIVIVESGQLAGAYAATGSPSACSVERNRLTSGFSVPARWLTA